MIFKKRGQIVLFILSGMMIFAFLVLIVVIKSMYVEKVSESEIKRSTESRFDRSSIIFFVDSCLKQVSKKAIFTRTGLRGGYIDPAGNLSYGEEGTLIYIPDEKIPYYVFGKDTYIPSLAEIEKKIANYVIVEFERCNDFSVYEKGGYNITKPEIDYVASNFTFGILPAKINVSINENDVNIKVHYPLEFRRKNKFIDVDAFMSIIPVNLGVLYQNASNMAREIANASGAYNISKQCGRYNLNGATEIYYRNGQFIEFIDYSSLNEDYEPGYYFRFGVNGADVNGNCTI